MSDAPATTQPAHHSRNDRPTDETIKETFESIIIAFILAFVFRAYVVEAFVIPTGSMAPTLLGQHLHVTCKECGYSFDIDPPPGSPDWPHAMAHPKVAICPMCLYPNPIDTGTFTSSGDRILVEKYVYKIVEPSRWDTVVFKNPQDPEVNFIKRLIGLPGEQIWIIEGNIYHKSAAAPESAWRIARKSEARQGELVQRAVWQPIYHSNFVPLDDGKHSVDRQVSDSYRVIDRAWHVPWIADDPAHWSFTDAQSHAAMSYHYDGTAASRVRFDFNTTTAGAGVARWYPYNEFSQMLDDLPLIASSMIVPNPPVEDVRLAADFKPEKPGLSVTLQTTARLGDQNPTAGPVPLRGRIDSAGHAFLEELNPDGFATVLAQGDCGPFTPGEARKVELWFVDQEASLWVEGRQVLDVRFDLPIDTVINRPPLAHWPEVSIEVAGSPVMLHRVQLDRDLYYTPNPNGNMTPGLGALIKDANTRIGSPLTLEADQFFCLGDNSPRSSDGRVWSSVNPWILTRMLAGKKQQTGVVPRNLMMGRAFFVYFPAMYSWDPKRSGIFPNFGAVRFIH